LGIYLAKGGKGKGRPKKREKRLGQRDISHHESSKTLNPKNPVSKLQELNLAQTYSYVHFILGSNKHEVKAN